VIGAGVPVAVPGRGDRTYPFRSHSEYFYLTDRERPGGALAFDPNDGRVDFVVPISREERLWGSLAPTPADEGKADRRTRGMAPGAARAADSLPRQSAPRGET